jgi:hypothetical protein
MFVLQIMAGFIVHGSARLVVSFFPFFFFSPNNNKAVVLCSCVQCAYGRNCILSKATEISFLIRNPTPHGQRVGKAAAVCYGQIASLRNILWIFEQEVSDLKGPECLQVFRMILRTRELSLVMYIRQKP